MAIDLTFRPPTTPFSTYLYSLPRWLPDLGASSSWSSMFREESRCALIVSRSSPQRLELLHT